jgi:hypothetical protein
MTFPIVADCGGQLGPSQELPRRTTRDAKRRPLTLPSSSTAAAVLVRPVVRSLGCPGRLPGLRSSAGTATQPGGEFCVGGVPQAAAHEDRPTTPRLRPPTGQLAVWVGPRTTTEGRRSDLSWVF